MNYHKLILEGLEEWIDIISNHKKRATVAMLRHFIILMGEKHFNNAFEYYFVGDMEFDDGWYGFHKSMRQVDFYDIGEGSLDMLFWNFIHMTDLPYEILKVFTEKIKVGVVDEIENDLAGTKGWDKFGFFCKISKNG